MDGVDRLDGQRLAVPRLRVPPATLVAIGSVAAVALVLVVQALHLDEALDVTQRLTAGYAKALVLGYALVVMTGAVLVALLPIQRLWMIVAASGALSGIALIATLGPGGQLWSFAWALLILCACGQVGAWTLRAIRTPSLAAVPAIAVVAGIGIVGLILLFVGRLSLLSPVDVAVPIALLGILGGARLVRELADGHGRRAWSAMTGTRMGAACTAVSVLMAGLALVWAAAPEMGYDALYAKAWLPEEWARTGEIRPLLDHAILNIVGFAQIIPIPGHQVGAHAVGRYLQWAAYGLMIGTVWWGARRSPWAPVAAAVVAVTPQLFWEATTAYDDVLLALAGVAIALAVVRLLESPAVSPLAGGLALGVLAAACFNLKTHMAALAAGLVLGWLLLRGRRGFVAAFGGAVLGSIAFAAPPLVLRWVDTGNPVLPSLNGIFRSPYWLPQNTHLDFPHLKGYDPISTLWATVTNTSALEGWAPVGALGLLTLAMALGLVACWGRRRFDRRIAALWVGLLVAAVAWYWQFRNTRYALPAGALAVLLIALTASPLRVQPGSERAALAVLAAVAVLLWPSTVSQFFYVPGRDIPWQAAIGETSDREYEQQATPARAAIGAFDRLAPPGAVAAAEPPWRTWLTQGRDIAPFWELDLRIRLEGPRPVDPAATLARVRRLGIGWVLDDGATLNLLPYLRNMVTAYGKPVWRSGPETLYRLPRA